jgi:hypothetical protein
VKIKDGFMLREIAGSWVVIPLGQRVVEFNGMISLNESSVLLWNKLEKGATIDELVQAILSEYDIDEETARADVEEFVKLIKENYLLE